MNIRLFYGAQLTWMYNGEKSPLVTIVQKELARRGYYHDGGGEVLDDATAQALASFQKAEGLSVTGIIDPKTLCRLNAPPPTDIAPVWPISRKTAGLAKSNIIIYRSRRQLTLYAGQSPIRHFPIAIGKPSTPTPLGNFAIATKIHNPGGVLGTRWMGLNYDAYGIHGTNAPWLIGQMVSNGCIRMHNPNAEELFTLVNVGTAVYIRE